MARIQNSLQTLTVGTAAAAAGLTGLAAIILLAAGILLNLSGLTYASVAMLAFLLPLAAGLLRGKDFDPFEPINLVALAILFGTTLRAIWLLTTDATAVADFIMMGTTMEAVSNNAPLMLGSVLCLVIGYVVFPYRLALERFTTIRRYSLSAPRIRLALGIIVIVSLIGIPWMMIEFGIDVSGGLLSSSYKRVATYVNESGEIVYGAGYQRFIAAAAKHGFVFLVALIIAGFASLRAPVAVSVVVLGLMTAIVPFLTSTRGALVLPAIQLAMFAYYYRKLSLKTVVTVGLVGALVLSFLGQLREMNQTRIRDLSTVDRIIGSGNSIDLVRTSAIMDRVPSANVPFQHGKTYLALFAAPIPRAAWPDKPLIGLGGFVKKEIFGQRIRMGGWPSGMIAEGWINFGMWGLFFPLFLFGAFLRWIYETVRPLLGVSFPITLLYAVSAFRLGFGSIGLNFAHGIADTLTYFAPMLLMVIIARKPLAVMAYAPQLRTAPR